MLAGISAGGCGASWRRPSPRRGSPAGSGEWLRGPAGTQEPPGVQNALVGLGQAPAVLAGWPLGTSPKLFRAPCCASLPIRFSGTSRRVDRGSQPALTGTMAAVSAGSVHLDIETAPQASPRSGSFQHLVRLLSIFRNRAPKRMRQRPLCRHIQNQVCRRAPAHVGVRWLWCRAAVRLRMLASRFLGRCNRSAGHWAVGCERELCPHRAR